MQYLAKSRMLLAKELLMGAAEVDQPGCSRRRL
jgi:hypothetical protein